jgi:hypothetical protein
VVYARTPVSKQRVHLIKSFVFLSTGAKFSSINWLALIDNHWTRINGLRDNKEEILIFKMPPRLHIFYFNVAIYFTTYLHYAVLIIYFNHYIIKLLPLRQAFLKRGKLTCPDLPVSKYYRVIRRELVY